MLRTYYPNMLSYHRNSLNIFQIKSNLDRVSREAVTGQIADITAASNGNLGDIHLIKKSLDDIEHGNQINSIVGSRLELVSLGINGSRAAIAGMDIKATTALAVGEAGGIDIVSDEARSAIFSVITSLSVTHGKRHLFSGDTIDTPAFAGATDQLLSDVEAILQGAATAADAQTALDTYFNDPAGGFKTNIYQGSDTSPGPVNLSNGERIDMNIRGDDPAIINTLRGLSVLAAATKMGQPYDSDVFKTVFQSGISSVSNGNQALISIEATLGIYSETVDKADQRNAFEEISLTEAYQGIVGRDQFEAAAELQSLQVQLESAYTITARMANLNLVNFLR